MGLAAPASEAGDFALGAMDCRCVDPCDDGPVAELIIALSAEATVFWAGVSTHW